MKLRCSECSHIGHKNDFLVPSDIIPPNCVKCPSCGQTNKSFFIVKMEENELDALDEFIKWIEAKHPDTWMTTKLLKKWVPLYRTSCQSTKVSESE